MPEEWDQQLAILRESFVAAEALERGRTRPAPPHSVSFRDYVTSRGHHALNHIEQIRAALT